MKREKQIELIDSAEERTKGYLRIWLQNPQFKAAVTRKGNAPKDGNTESHSVARVRRNA
jgi:hypothetical protein